MKTPDIMLKTLIKELTNGRQSEFARMVGISPKTLNHYLCGRGLMSVEFLQKILVAYPSVSAYFLISGEGEIFIQGMTIEVDLKKNRLQSRIAA